MKRTKVKMIQAVENKIPYVNLSAQWNSEKRDLLPLIEKVMESGIYVGGDNVKVFERNLARYCGTKYCVALNSGTDALMCSLLALGVSRGDEVITPPNSFIASTASIIHVGAKPVFVDVLEDQSIDPSKIERVITDKTKAIMPVHLTGRMAQMDKIKSIAKKYDLRLIEDAAQSIGSKFDQRLSGSIGDIGCFSAHPLKNLNACGDGGFIITNSTEVYSKISSYRNHGIVDRNTIREFGLVSRMDELQAAILNYRLNNLASTINKRRANAKIYRKLLNQNKVFFPLEHPKCYDSYHTFVIQCDDRPNLIQYLEKTGIQTAIHYPIPIHLQPAAQSLGYMRGDFPKTENQAEKILTLPINQSLSEDQIAWIANTINRFFER